MAESQNNLPRLVLYTQDIQKITGLSECSARRLMRKIRKALGKEAGSLLFVSEFCACTGLEEEYVWPFLR